MTTLMDLIYGIFQEARAIGATLETVIAAFCRLAKFLRLLSADRRSVPANAYEQPFERHIDISTYALQGSQFIQSLPELSRPNHPVLFQNQSIAPTSVRRAPSPVRPSG
jgi:hypothetical protein